MGIASDLRQSVLQAAIRGKLTTQKAEDGDARDLLREIRAEKEKLVKEQKIKKEKPLAPITDDEIPFDIPDNWVWCHIQDLFFAHSSMRIHQSDWKSKGIPFFRGRELVNLSKTGDPNATVFISEELYNRLKEKSGVPQRGDILITAVGTLGKVYVVQGTKEFYYKDAYILCLDNYGINSAYVRYFLESPYSQNYIYSSNAYGTTVAQLTLEKLRKMMIPLPPLAEQHRIVAHVDELMKEIDKLEKTEKELDGIKTTFPADMKASLLQAAMEGKLTTQKAEDGDARDLLREIRAEKEKLVKEKKIKKEKPLAPITDDEIPFDIPDNWVWCRFGEISTYASPKSKINAKKADKDTWMLDLEDIEKGGKLLTKIKVSDKKAIGDKTVFHSGDILYSKLRPYLLKILIANDDGICTPELIPFSMYGNIDTRYIVNFLKSPYVDNTINAATYGLKMPRVGTNTMVNLPIPLPPLTEQHRIVKKLDQLLPLCDGLSKD